jgi:hypothetical protein
MKQSAVLGTMVFQPGLMRVNEGMLKTQPHNTTPPNSMVNMLETKTM